MVFRNLTCLLVIGFASIILTDPAGATVLFSDDFDRSNNATVGNNWVESPSGGTRHNILNNQLQLIQNGQVTQNNISTLGFENIELNYDWIGFNAEPADTLIVTWSPDSFTTIFILATHNLATVLAQASGSETFSLGLSAEGLAAISIRFRISGQMGDTVFIDNVLLTGDPIQVIQVPEPSTIAMFGLGILGFGVISRRRRKRADVG